MENYKEYWKNKWENKEIAFHDDFANPLLMKYFSQLKLKAGDTVFVPLCGKTIDMTWFASQGLNVVGVELSPIACVEFFEAQQINPNIIRHEFFTIYEFQNIKLYCGDIFNLKKNDLPTISAIYDWKALVALPKEVRVKYVSHLLSCTGVKLNFLLLTLETKEEIVGPPFSVSDNEIQQHFGSLVKIEKIREELINPIPNNLIEKGWSSGVRRVYLGSFF